MQAGALTLEGSPAAIPEMVEQLKGVHDRLRDAEDKAYALVEKLDGLQRAIFFKYLYALGYRMGTIAAEIQRLARQ